MCRFRSRTISKCRTLTRRLGDRIATRLCLTMPLELLIQFHQPRLCLLIPVPCLQRVSERRDFVPRHKTSPPCRSTSPLSRGIMPLRPLVLRALHTCPLHLSWFKEMPFGCLSACQSFQGPLAQSCHAWESCPCVAFETRQLQKCLVSRSINLDACLGQVHPRDHSEAVEAALSPARRAFQERTHDLGIRVAMKKASTGVFLDPKR